MSILVIGQSAFLAQHLKHHATSKSWYFIGHNEALDAKNWPKDIKTVINFAYDPIIFQGEHSDLDHQLAKIAASQNAPYIMMSSRTAYGVSNDPVIITENQSPFETITPYGHAKKKIEEDLQANLENITILRLANIFGYEYVIDRPRQTFLGMLLKSLKEEGVIKFNMNPMTQRDFLPLQIFTEHLIKIAQAPKAGVYNLGAGFGTATGDIAQWIMDGYGQGKLLTEKDNVLDSFVLDMAKTNTAFNLDTITTDSIQTSCNIIGKELKAI